MQRYLHDGTNADDELPVYIPADHGGPTVELGDRDRDGNASTPRGLESD